MNSAVGNFMPRFPMDGYEELPIQVECPESQKREMLSRTASAWDRLGKEEPYFNVLTDQKFLKEQFGGQNEEEFWAVGKLEAERLVAWMKRNGVYSKSATILEYGCGVGRTTRWLYQYFEEVVAYDISEMYLSLAASVCSPKPWLAKISSLGDLRLLANCDVVFSLITLQHNPPPVMAHILNELLHALNPGGIAHFQLPTMIRGYTFNADDYLANPESGSQMEMHCLPQRYVFDIARRNGCEPLEVSQDDRTDCIDHVSTTFLLRKR